MKKKYMILTAVALLAAALLISACSHSEQPGSGSSSTSESTTASVETAVPEESTAADTDSTADASSEQPEGSVTVQVSHGTELLWTETAVDITMYVASDNVSSLNEALQHGTKVTTYHTNERLHLIALTDTGFYKLENGEYISKDDLSEFEIEVGTFISSVDATIYTTTPAKE